MENVVFVKASRTPNGKLLGHLSSLTAPQLCSKVIKEVLQKAGIKGSQVDEVIMGNVISAGIGQNPARQAALLSGLPQSVPAFTVNKVCASGFKAVTLAAQEIALGEAEIVIAGGMESMSNAPFLLKGIRAGKKHGHSEILDSMIWDGLWDCSYNAHMGALCEFTVKKYGISRADQDNFALQSHKKAISATKSLKFKEEIVPIQIIKNKKEITLEMDETIREDTTLKKLAKLKPVFGDGKTITAGNAPGLNDGAAALLLMSETKAKSLKLKPFAKIIGYSSSFLDPKQYPVAPVKSMKSLFKKTGLELKNFDLIEINEAFAAQTLAVMKELSINPKKVNIHGGAIALGQPIGASGARILVTLIHALKTRKKKLGLATICLGGGGAMSMAITMTLPMSSALSR